MEHAESRIQDIYLHLQEQGFNVYFPAQKVGECTSPYVVVKGAPMSKVIGLSSTVTYYDVMCYVPRNQYETLEPFVETVKSAMDELAPMIKPTYTQTPSYYDEGIGAHMVSVQYKNYRKIIT